MEESDKMTALKKAYAEMILNTAKESAAKVMISERQSARFYHDLCGTKEESLRLLVRLKQMIDAKTIEAEITSSNQQQQIDVLEAQLQEAEDIITDLRSELRWVRDKLEKAETLVNKEQETTSDHPEVVVASLHPCNQKVADTFFSVTTSESLLNQSSLHDDIDECGGNDEKQFDGLSVKTSEACDSELDANIGNKKLELSRNGCTQRIHALERKSSLSENEEGQCRIDKDSEKNLSSGNTRCLVLALRPRNAEVITTKQSNAPVIKKSRNLRGKRKRRWTKRKATPVRSQSQLIKPCQSRSDLPCSKTSMENSDGEASMETHLSVEDEDVDTLNACKGSEEHLQHTADGIGIIRKGKRSKNMEDLCGISSLLNSTDHVVEACQESSLVSINVEDGETKADIPKDETKLKLLPRLDSGLTSNIGNVDLTSGSTNVTVVGVTHRSTDKDLKSRKEGNVIPSTKDGSELVRPCSDSKAAAMVSDQISESSRANTNRLVMYTFQRKRKRDRPLKEDDDKNHLPGKRKENNAQDSTESTFV